MVVYQVCGTELKIDVSFLKVAKQEQAKAIRGVYGWYMLANDLPKLSLQSGILERIYLYVATVSGQRLKSVTSRFLGQLCGAQVCTDKDGKKFDTDFAVGCVIAFLSDKGVDVYFHVLSDEHGRSREVAIAREVKPALQVITTSAVRLHPSIKREVQETATGVDTEKIGEAVIDRLQEALHGAN